MSNTRILVNAISASLQVVITAVIYFFLYRYLVKHLGADQLGIWSLVLATSSIANLANFGITSGLVKFVAEYKATQRQKELPVLVGTAFFTVAVFFLILSIFLFFVASFVLYKVVDKQYFLLAKEILPYSILSLFLNEIGGVFTSVLEGFQKNYLRNIVYSIAIIVFFVLTVILTPQYGLKGVAYAQVIQAVLILIVSVFLSCKYFFNRSVSFFTWQKATFKRIVSYGVKFQVVSICQMLYEPTTKAILSKFGGLSVVGYYEMATRLISSVRALIVNANQVMVPVVTEASFTDKDVLKNIYSKTFSLTIVIAVIAVSGTIVLTPLISLLWTGGIQISFIVFAMILAVANLVNIVCGPAYFGFLGQGVLNPLIKVHLLMAVLNALLSYVLGYFWQGYGVVIAWGISLCIASSLLIYYYAQLNSLNTLSIIKKVQGVLLSGALLFAITVIVLVNKKGSFSNDWIIKTTVLEAIACIGVFSFFLYRNKTVNLLAILKRR